MATSITQYRRESAYIRELEAMSISMGSEIKSLYSENVLADSVTIALVSENTILRDANMRKDSTITMLSTNLTAIHTVASDALKPPGFFERPLTWGTIGFIIGFLLTR